MALPNDGTVVTVESSAVEKQGVVYAIKLTEEEEQKLIRNDQGLTLAIDKTGVGRLTVGEEIMTMSVRHENADNFECYSRQGNRCVKLSAKDKQRQRERTIEAEKKKRARQLLVSDSAKVGPKSGKSRTSGSRSLLNSARSSMKRPIRRPAPSLPAPKKLKLTPSPHNSPASPERSSPAPSKVSNSSKAKLPPKHQLNTQPPKHQAAPKQPSQPKPQRVSAPPRVTPSPPVSRAVSPPTTSPLSPQKSPKKSVADLRTGVIHILALGKTSLTTMRERLPEFEYGKKIEILKKVGKYTGEGYILKEKYWDEIDSFWPHYTPDEQDIVEEARENMFIRRRSKFVIDRLPAPEPEQKDVAEAFDRAWARWKDRKFTPRPEITCDEKYDEYYAFYTKWLPHYQAILAQSEILVHYFKQYLEVYESLEYRFEYEAAEKHIDEVTTQWKERHEQANFLMNVMTKELIDVKKKIERWEAKNDSEDDNV